MIKIAPSILAADFSMLRHEIERVESGGADLLHIDVMDGHFVPNISFGVPVVSSLRKWSKLTFDVHLMISNPERYIEISKGRVQYYICSCEATNTFKVHTDDQRIWEKSMCCVKILQHHYCIELLLMKWIWFC